MLRQYELGSGLRGAMKFAVTGESGLASMLSPLNDAEFQIRSILSGKTMSTQLYAVKNDTETAQTEICRMDGQWYLKTSLLLDSTLSLPDRGDLLSTLSSSETLGNPSFYSFILSFLSADPALWKGVNIDASVNKWLEAYVQKPVLMWKHSPRQKYLLAYHPLWKWAEQFSQLPLRFLQLKRPF